MAQYAIALGASMWVMTAACSIAAALGLSPLERTIEPIGIIFIADAQASDEDKADVQLHAKVTEAKIAKRVLEKVGKYMSEGVQWGQGTRTGEELAASRGIKRANPVYSNLKRNKAITVCVAWESSTIDFLNVRVYGGAHYQGHIGGARELSMWHCEKSKAKKNIGNCECHILIENDNLVLKVPKSFLDRN